MYRGRTGLRPLSAGVSSIKHLEMLVRDDCSTGDNQKKSGLIGRGHDLSQCSECELLFQGSRRRHCQDRFIKQRAMP